MNRFFLGLAIEAPWPEEWPEGREIKEKHATLLFFRTQKFSQDLLFRMPLPSFPIGPIGTFDTPLFLPEKSPRAFAWHISWEKEEISHYQKTANLWWQKEGVHLDEREWLPHVTLARAPLQIDQWQTLPLPLPCFAKALHLYESLGESTYRILWSHFFVPPFKEIEHTADLAFHVYGRNFQELFCNALWALSFQEPLLLQWKSPLSSLSSIEDVIRALNALFLQADISGSLPYKAVTHHGEVHKSLHHLLEWEMIIDV
ncbi:MAG: hypothetical protein KGI80_00185 [Verrucomicrobiota bacterium]|nr:hypothetical protein [Verrucomicrobiota bacterium]